MRQQDPAPRRAYYGLAEIADALGLSRQLVTVWRRRRSHDMPEPTAELSSGPIWHGAAIEPWIDRLRTQRDGDAQAVPLTPELAARLARRVLRLLVLLLEDRPRPQLLAQAVAAVRDVEPAVEATQADDDGRLARTVLAALAGDSAPAAVRARLADVLPDLARLVRKANAEPAAETAPNG
ncbi:helix-turn-helix transcriptional regulator [Amycolatopsis sp. cmx-4-68]|uniref:helix-turn-helix transcriptional regulator n=1 Tax=Amycolatopsis sp. cmx-4-68 TaxID=2790938 RepID=UPI00397B3185